MDETIRRRQEQIADCRQAIEISRAMITLSRRWLAAYYDSFNAEHDAGAIRHASVLEQLKPLKLD